MNILAVNPTHRAYGMTSRSQLLDASKMMAVVIQMQPTKMHINASSHSGWSSGVKHWYGRLYSVIHVHIRPSRVSPANWNQRKEKINRNSILFVKTIHSRVESLNWITSNISYNPIRCSQTDNRKYISSHKERCTYRR